jgi:pyruvate carboxylase
MDSMSGLTSQPNLGSIVAALEHTDKDPQLGRESLFAISQYWEGVRRYYAPFEADMRSGTSDVYRHEMPGGQYTNLREQARAMGIEHRWNEVSQAYADVNKLFGDIVKVTPTSKVVGDMALFMVANDLTPADVSDPDKEIAFPESVISLFKGELGFPADGFPKALEKKVLKGGKPLEGRYGANVPPVDLYKTRETAEKAVDRKISEQELASYLMYPKVFTEYAQHHRAHGDVSVLPTDVFFEGLKDGQEISVSIDQGKTLVIRLLGRTEIEEEGQSKLFFELNGQPRMVRVQHAGVISAVSHPKAADGNSLHVGAPMPGMVVTVAVKPGQKIAKGDPLVSIEAMKMETMIRAEFDGMVQQVHVKPGMVVAAKDLLVELQG